MRVTRRIQEERGAIAVIVGISLIVLLGMLALALDLGRAVASKRDMVNAADAAALAGAQECAFGHGSAAAQADALDTAELNGADGLTAFEADPECDNLETGAADKLVSVTVDREVDYYVAPVLGFDSITVTASATALWGAATRSAPIPLRIDINSLVNCGIDPDSNEHVTCRLPFGNNDPEGAANDWGWLYFGGEDGAGWDTTDCASQAGGATDPISFITGSLLFNAQLNVPPPTYVCSYSGNAQSVVNALIGREGSILSFPIVDAYDPVENPDGYPVVGQGANLAWPVITFAKLRLINVYEQPGASTFCPGLEDMPGQDEFCLELRWEGPQPGGAAPGDVPYFGVPAVRLVK